MNYLRASVIRNFNPFASKWKWHSMFCKWMAETMNEVDCINYERFHLNEEYVINHEHRHAGLNVPDLYIQLSYSLNILLISFY